MELIDEEIYDRFKIISKKLMMLQKEIMVKLKLGLSEYRLISTLSENDFINQTSISGLCGIDKPAVSRLVDKMIDAGYIQRHKNKNNRRELIISLTDSGKIIGHNIKREIINSLWNYFEKLPLRDKKKIIRLLDKCLLED